MITFDNSDKPNIHEQRGEKQEIIMREKTENELEVGIR